MIRNLVILVLIILLAQCKQAGDKNVIKTEEKPLEGYSVELQDFSQLPFTVYAESDTMYVGEAVKVTVKMKEPRLKNFRVIIGNYDKNFNVVDSSTLGQVLGEDSIASFFIKIDSVKNKTKTLRGVIEEYEYLENGYVDTRTHVFKKEFAVLDADKKLSRKNKN
ncbi:hypothetical protein R9C00_14790 [Flammeovirgaceae bacterium SG7u.111]|nr:hypothetical protein [Flammeovirgaceae bacterium SG7u.132]WPO38726.1 hypothetical protein R9C00_14790 [Flammeovirgaceae bacterium SG7u.111]